MLRRQTKESGIEAKTNNKGLPIVVIGLDGADPALTARLSREGRIPTLTRMMREGVYSPLKSTVPFHSGPAWTSFSTGAAPDRTGIYSFSIMEAPYKFRHVFSRDVRLPRFWDIAGDSGYRVGVANFPLTEPPCPVNGFLIAGLPGHEEHAYPPDVHRAKYESAINSLQLPDIARVMDGHSKLTLIKDLARVEAATELACEHDVDLLVIVIDILDRVQHRYWSAMDPEHPAHGASLPPEAKDMIPAAYNLADGMVARIMEKFGDDASYVILSDHGFRSTKYCVNILKLLMAKGAVRIKPAAPDQEIYESMEVLDLPNCAMYTCHDNLTTALGLNANIRGREPHGTMPPEKADRLLYGFAKLLEDEKEPNTGQPVFESVHLRQDIYSGPMAHLAPDILMISEHRLVSVPAFSELSIPVEPPPFGQNFTVNQMTGGHAPRGIFIGCGPAVNRSVDLVSEPEIIDLAPSILHALGLSAPVEMDGRVLPFFRQVASPPEDPGGRRETSFPGDDTREISEEDKEKAMRHLRGMGYL